MEDERHQSALAVSQRRREGHAREHHLGHADFPTSDHPGIKTAQGPQWVASVVDAVGGSKFWNSTAIFILWDDWGGMFDPVKPVFEDYDGLGFRVPLIVVSPYAKQSSVTHAQYETASVLRFMEDDFGLAPLQ